jgi:hypothetical protein
MKLATDSIIAENGTQICHGKRFNMLNISPGERCRLLCGRLVTNLS